MLDFFTLSFAERNLRYNFRQSLLTVSIVTISVTLIIFLTALISGLQRRLISDVTDAVAHIVVRPAERLPIAAWKLGPSDEKNTISIGETVRLEQRKRKIEDWQIWVRKLENFDPRVLAVSPVAEGQGILSRGEKRQGVLISGGIPEKYNRVVELQSKLVKGRFFGLNAGELVLGWKLADDFAVQIGDRVRLVSSDDNSGSYMVAGIFDSGFSGLDGNTVILALRDAQSLFGLGNAVTSIGLKIGNVFQAEDIASKIALQVPYEARPWTLDNKSLLSGLNAQSQSSYLIIAFTVVASGMAVAAILVMMVIGKMRELGILKAMGATRRQILSVFAIQGTLLALTGGVFGSVIGTGFCLFLGKFTNTASATGRLVQLFPMELSAGTVLGAVGLAAVTGLAASLLPAWRAARINPIEVIRPS
jgi:lipoprotein-releasing system permease protein